MSTEKALARPPPESGDDEHAKRARYGRCFSGLELKMEARPLKELDPEKLKNEIKRWAKAVVRYARQLSGSFSSRGSTRRQVNDSFSSDGKPES